MICEISSKFNFWTKIWLLTQCEADGNLLTLFLWAVGLQARFCCMSWLQKTCHQSRIKTDDVFNIRFSRDRWEVCRVFRAPWIPTLWPWSRGYTIFYTKTLHLESKVPVLEKVPGVPTSSRQEFSKKSLNVTKCEKTRESLFTF